MMAGLLRTLQRKIASIATLRPAGLAPAHVVLDATASACVNPERIARVRASEPWIDYRFARAHLYSLLGLTQHRHMHAAKRVSDPFQRAYYEATANHLNTALASLDELHDAVLRISRATSDHPSDEGILARLISTFRCWLRDRANFNTPSSFEEVEHGEG